MRRKTGHADPRHLDLIATFVLLLAIVAAWRFLSSHPEAPTTTALIVPSQSVRW